MREASDTPCGIEKSIEYVFSSIRLNDSMLHLCQLLLSSVACNSRFEMLMGLVEKIRILDLLIPIIDCGEFLTLNSMGLI